MLPLDQAGDSLIFNRSPRGQGSADFFGAVGLKSGAFLGSYRLFEYAFVWRIRSQDQDRYISEGHFTNGGFGFGSGTMIKGSIDSLQWQWDRKGDGFIGFTSDTAFSRVRIKSRPGSGFQVTMDNLTYSVTAPGVPEPASWAMMIAGFGLAGAAMRARPRVKGTATA